MCDGRLCKHTEPCTHLATFSVDLEAQHGKEQLWRASKRIWICEVCWLNIENALPYLFGRGEG